MTYIERQGYIQTLLGWFAECKSNGLDYDAEVIMTCIEQLNDHPAADVAPVVHGRWEYEGPTINTYGRVICSCCGWWSLDPSVSTVYHYCPNCGADMREGRQ